MSEPILDARALKMKAAVMDAPFEVCPKCGGRYFRSVNVFKKISKLAIGAPDDVLYPIPVYVCDKCGELAPSMLEDEDLKKILGGGEEEKKEEKKSGLIL